MFTGMKIFHILILFLSLLSFTSQTHHIYQIRSLSSQDFEKDDLIAVEETAKNKSEDAGISPNYYVIRVLHKEKKQAYMRMQNIFKKVVRVLTRNRIIPDEDSLVKSRIKPQYFSKKRVWSFSTIFIIFGNEKELDNCYNLFSRMRIQRLNTKPSINFLNEKVVALQVFNSAKKRLSRELERFPQFEIKQVVNIQIRGKVENSDIIQMQLEEEFNEWEKVLNEEEMIQGVMEDDQQSVEMKIIFRVGRKNEDDSNDYDDYEDDDQEEEDSQSDDSEESL